MQRIHTTTEIKSLLATKTSSGSIPLFSSTPMQLPGTVNADPIPEEGDEVELLPFAPNLEELAAEFRSNQQCILTIDYKSISSALKLLDSKKYTATKNTCCDIAEGVCCENRLAGLAGILVCGLVGGCCGFLGLFARITSPCLNTQYQAFNKLSPDEKALMQQHLVVVKLDDFIDVMNIPVEKYSSLYTILDAYKQAISLQYRLRTSTHLSIFYASMSQVPIHEKTKELLLSCGALDLVAEYLQDVMTPTPPTRKISL